jgi:hypothetical protein
MKEERMRQHSGLERRTAKNSIRIPAAEKGVLFARIYETK